MHPMTTAATWAATDAWHAFTAWLSESYSTAPALMLAMIAVLALPPLAIGGMALRRQRRSPDATVIVSRPSRRDDAKPRAVTMRTSLASWPTEAWLEHADGRHVIDRAMLRIGREADNDIALTEKTVHRYHAAVRRSSDGTVVITDLSGQDGNGIFVNGGRVSEARLKPGDVIAIGKAHLKFAAKSV